DHRIPQQLQGADRSQGRRYDRRVRQFLALVEEHHEEEGCALLGGPAAAGDGRSHDVRPSLTLNPASPLIDVPDAAHRERRLFHGDLSMTSLEQSAPTSLRLVAADGARFGIIALIAFLTLVDLFATQAILPSLVVKFGVSRAT